MTTIEAAPRAIDAPSDFPVRWDDPADAHALWEREVMHAPEQVTVLDAEVGKQAIEGGFGHAAELFSLPVRMRYRRVNTYMYQAFVPVSHDPAQLEALGREAEARAAQAMARMREWWEGEQLPEVRRHVEALDAFDLAGASTEAFVAHWDDSLARFARLWEIHFDLTIAPLLAMSLFDDLYRELLAPEGAFESLALLAGFDNLTFRGNRALHALGRRAAEAPAVRAALTGAEPLAALDATAEGRAFRGELDAYLQEYGRRTLLFFTPSTPSYAEDPSVVVAALQEAIARPERDPDAELAAAAAERERLVAEARTRLAPFPQPVREQFEGLLAAAQYATVLQEDHNFWIDARGTYELRRVALEAGRRLVAAGAVDAVDDVFHLGSPEIRAGLAGGGDLRPLVAGRKAELARFADVQAPPVLGSFPPGPPPTDPISRAVGKFFGIPPAPAQTPDVVTGVGGSPGVVRARARVVRSIQDADRLRAGEVLVTQTTAPPWTPLFARAAAIVTDAGGILSHCAVVAREYLIPAVVATGVGTVAIPDGALVEVDGTAGTVRIVEPA